MNENKNNQIRPGVPTFVDNKGNKITKDESYSQEFWQKQPVGMKEAMQENIKSSLVSGIFRSFVEPAGGDDFDENNLELDEKSKQSLSAYRILANEMGYEIGNYTLNKSSKSVEAVIIKK